MSINLQQQTPVRVELKTGSGESIAIHRALGSILFYSPTEGDGGTFEIFRREGIEIEGNWVKTGSWDLPPNQDKCVIISAAGVETMGAFLVVLLINKEASVLFLDALNCMFISISELSSTVLPVCADIDQNRKELLLGFTRGVLVSFAIRQQNNPNIASNIKKIKINENCSHKIIQTLSRKQVKINQVLGSRFQNEVFSISQIAHSDITGGVFILSEEGSICCLETSSLVCLFLINSNLFKYIPVFLWVDKYGSDFIVLCSKNGNSKKQTEIKKDEDDVQLLEYWKIPINYDDAKKGLFNRLQLPVHGQLTALVIETIHPDLSTMIITVTNKNQIQLFLNNEKDGTITVDSSMFLSKNDMLTETEKSYQNPNQNKSINHYQSNDFTNYSNNNYDDSNYNDYNNKTSGHFRGVSTFIESTFSLPDCPVIFLSCKNKNITTVALHVPTLSDILNRRKCLFIAASKVEISVLPKKIKINDEIEDFLEKFHEQNSLSNLFSPSALIGTGTRSGILLKNSNSKLSKNNNLIVSKNLNDTNKYDNNKNNNEQDILLSEYKMLEKSLMYGIKDGNNGPSSSGDQIENLSSLLLSDFYTSSTSINPNTNTNTNSKNSNTNNSTSNLNSNLNTNSNNSTSISTDLSHLDNSHRKDISQNNLNISIENLSRREKNSEKSLNSGNQSSGSGKDENGEKSNENKDDEILFFGSDMDDQMNTGRSRGSRDGVGTRGSKDNLSRKSSRINKSRQNTNTNVNQNTNQNQHQNVNQSNKSKNSIITGNTDSMYNDSIDFYSTDDNENNNYYDESADTNETEEIEEHKNQDEISNKDKTSNKNDTIDT